MSDPADKSDDLIAELARLMATPTAPNKPAVQPVSARPAATAPAAAPAPAASGPVPIRIPGMDSMTARNVPAQPAPAAEPTPAVAPQPEPRPAATGAIRIPGMDQPPPVTASAPVGKFEFPGAQPVKAEPILSLSDRIARSEDSQNRVPQPPQPAVVRVNPPSAESARAPEPQVSQARSAAAPSQAPSASPPSDFHFDFGFSNNPPQPSAASQGRAAASAVDPIAALIEADLAAPTDTAAAAEAPGSAEPVVRTPTVARFTQPAPAPTRPAVAPAPTNVQRAAATPVPLKQVSTAPRSNPAADRFMFAPGTGLDMKAEPVMPPREGMTPANASSVDPMDQLESLIGEAVRVELTPEPARAQQPQVVSPKVQLEPEPELAAEIRGKGEAPVVPPLNSAFAPRRTRIKDEQRGADDAILAAVAAGTPADMSPVAEPAPQDGPYRRLKVKPQRTGLLSGGMRQVIGMAVAGTLLLAAGLGLYWVLNMGRTANVSGDNAPQLTADSTPVKVKPADTQKPETDAAKSPVLAKIDGASTPAGGEQLVSTEDATAGTVTRDVTPTNVDSEGGLANRKVRTVTVRPDGTIVPGDDAVAGTQELPVDRPNVPDVPATETTTLLNGDPSAQTPAVAATTLPSVGDGSTDPVATASAADQLGDAPVIDPTAVAPQPMNFPVRTAATTPLAAPEAPLGSTVPANSQVNAVVSAQTPDGQIDLLNDGATTAAKPAPAKPANSGGAVAYVQLSSQATQADGQAAARAATSKYGNLFGGQQLVVQQADLGQKGIRWRVRLPVSSLGEAQSVCAQIKAQGGDCFATGG